MKKKTRRKAKGMTLIEVIISMLVFGVAGLIMVVTGTTTKKLMMNTNHMNNKTNAEAPVAAVRDVGKVQEAAQSVTDPSTGAQMQVETETVDITVTVNGSGNSQLVKTRKYSTAAMAAADSNNTNTNMQGHLDFYVLDTTEPTT